MKTMIDTGSHAINREEPRQQVLENDDLSDGF